MITWGCTADALTPMDRLAREWNAGVHIHINETRAEVQISLEATGMRQIEWLDSLGVLNERWQLVHCVWLDESEIRIVAERGRHGRALPGEQHIPGLGHCAGQ